MRGIGFWRLESTTSTGIAQPSSSGFRSLVVGIQGKRRDGLPKKRYRTLHRSAFRDKDLPIVEQTRGRSIQTVSDQMSTSHTSMGTLRAQLVTLPILIMVIDI